MTCAAHNGPLFSFQMTSFAVGMECLSQARGFTGSLFVMAISAALVFGRLVFQFLPIFINMVAFIAFFDPSSFVVLVMPKDSRGALIF